MINYKFETPVKAWSELNKAFIRQDPELVEPGQGAVITGSIFSYGLSVLIENAEFEEDFDFGSIMGYTISKWSTLLNNYLDLDGLDKMKHLIREMEKNKAVNRNYHIAFSFADAHNNGKGCLTSGMFSRLIYVDKPRLTIIMRASEITTRLPWDLLLACRMGEYVYGHREFSIELIIRSAWCDDVSCLLYNGYEPIEPIIDAIENEERKKKLRKALRKSKKAAKEGTDPKFQAYTRVYKILNPEAYGKESKPLLAKDCIIGNWDGIPLPEKCPSIVIRNRIKKAYLDFTQKYGLNIFMGEVDKSQKSFKFNQSNDTLDEDALPFEEDEPTGEESDE